MFTVVIVGPRHRGWSRSVNNGGLIRSVLLERKEYYGSDLNVASISCDVGFGADLKAYCEEAGVKMIEFVIYFNGPREKEEYSQAYLARHAALVEIGNEFHLAVSNSRRSTVEDLVSRVKASGKPYFIYDEDNVLMESKDAQTSNAR